MPSLPRLPFAVLLLLSPLSAQVSIPMAKGLEVTFRPPSKWSYLGPNGTYGNTRAVFGAARAYAATKAKGHPVPHTPTIRFLWLHKPATEAKVGDWPVLRQLVDTADYIKRAHGPGAKVSAVDQDTLGGLKAEVNVLDVPSDSGDLKVLICSAKVEGGELLVEFTCIAEQFKKLRKSVDRAIGGMKVVVGGEAQAPAELGPAPGMGDREAWLKKSPSDRSKARREWGKAWLDAERKRDQPGYKAKVEGNLLVLSRTDSKYTKRITAAARLASKWVDEHFAAISDDEVMPAVLRIFDSRDELNTYLGPVAPNREFDHPRREIYAYKDASMGNLGDGYGSVIRGVWAQYVHDKHPLILDNLPRWIVNGFWAVLDSTRVVKSRKLLFFPTDVEIGRFKYHADEGKTQKTWWFIQEQMSKLPENGEPEEPYGYTPEAARILRWWLEDKAANKLYKQDDILCAYLHAIGKEAESFQPRPDLNVDWRYLEEDKQKQLRKAALTRRMEFLKKVNYGLIPLSEGEWAKADAAWAAWSDEFQKRKFAKK